MVELLIEKYVHINEKSSDGWAALHYLCKNYPHENPIELVNLLIENGIDINAKTSVMLQFGHTLALIMSTPASINSLIKSIRFW